MSSRIIACVDLDAFFAAIEQRDYPELRGLPVVIANSHQGSVIAVSYEGRAQGIRAGMPLSLAYQKAPWLVCCRSRIQHYSEVSDDIMQALADFCPKIEVFSIDEAFIDLTGYPHPPMLLASQLQRIVYAASGLSASVGISSDKTTAKLASKQQKPGGLTYVASQVKKHWLARFPVQALCGVSTRIQHHLNAHGVFYCGDMQRIPIQVLSQPWGAVGRRLWMMAQGQDLQAVTVVKRDQRAMGHSKVLPPGCQDEAIVQAYLLYLCDKLAYRLSNRQWLTQSLVVKVTIKQSGAIQCLREKVRLPEPVSDAYQFFSAARGVLSGVSTDVVYRTLSIRTGDLIRGGQSSWLPMTKEEALAQALYNIRRQYGFSAIIRSGCLLCDRSQQTIA